MKNMSDIDSLFANSLLFVVGNKKTLKKEKKRKREDDEEETEDVTNKKPHLTEPESTNVDVIQGN